MGRIITFTTDFGLKDPYQGAMKGAVLSINPEVTLVDITHLISPGNILEAAFVLLEAYSYYPPGTIHVGVVDPGVGGERKPILMETENYLFVGPDNGLFSMIADREKLLRVIHLKNSEFFRSEVSNTFHGRDIFGPVAAHLSLGIEPGLFGELLEEPKRLDTPVPEKREREIKGEVIYVDSFGNLITNIKNEEIARYKADDMEVKIKGKGLKGIKKTYSAVERGALLALMGSSKLLEIAVNSGAASKLLDAKTGDKVTVRIKG